MEYTIATVNCTLQNLMFDNNNNQVKRFKLKLMFKSTRLKFGFNSKNSRLVHKVRAIWVQCYEEAG